MKFQFFGYKIKNCFDVIHAVPRKVFGSADCAERDIQIVYIVSQSSADPNTDHKTYLLRKSVCHAKVDAIQMMHFLLNLCFLFYYTSEVSDVYYGKKVSLYFFFNIILAYVKSFMNHYQNI